MVSYRLDHPELLLRKVTKNLGVSESSLKKTVKVAKEHKGEVSPCGSGNYICEEAKEIARFQRELRDTKDAIKNLYDVLCELDVKYMESWKSL